MNRSVQAICTYDCGQVTIPEESFRLFVSRTNPELSHYTFTCSSCNRFCTRPASEHILMVLLAEGFRPEPYELPSDERPEGPPLVTDDLLDLISIVNAHGVLDHEPKYVTSGSHDPTTKGEQE